MGASSYIRGVIFERSLNLSLLLYYINIIYIIFVLLWLLVLYIYYLFKELSLLALNSPWLVVECTAGVLHTVSRYEMWYGVPRMGVAYIWPKKMWYGTVWYLGLRARTPNHVCVIYWDYSYIWFLDNGRLINIHFKWMIY